MNLLLLKAKGQQKTNRFSQLMIKLKVRLPVLAPATVIPSNRRVYLLYKDTNEAKPPAPLSEEEENFPKYPRIKNVSIHL